MDFKVYYKVTLVVKMLSMSKIEYSLLSILSNHNSRFCIKISTTNPNSMKYQVRFHTEFLYSKTGEWIPQFMYAERHQYQQRDFCFIQLHSKKVKREDKVRSTKQGRSRERAGPQLTNVRCRTSKTASLHPQSQPHFRGFTNCPGFSRRQKFHSCLLTFFMAMFIMNTHQCHSYEAWI